MLLSLPKSFAKTFLSANYVRPIWLANAHEKLDRAVFASYGWPPDPSEEEILKNLLALNLERSKDTEETPP